MTGLRMNIALNDCISISNDVIEKAKNKTELLKGICDAGVKQAAFLRISVLDRFNAVEYDSDDSDKSLLDNNHIQTLQTAFDKAVIGNVVVLKRPLMDKLFNKQAFGVSMVPIFEKDRATMMLCVISREDVAPAGDAEIMLKQLARKIELGLNTLESKVKMASAKKRRAFLENIYQESEEGIAIVNLDARIIDVNNSFCTMNRLDKTAAMGTELEEYKNKDLWSAITSKITNNRPWIGKRVVKGGNGQKETYWVKIIPMVEAGDKR